ncbi:hypothetical protein PVAG01_01604 [Phlyctema vagabunda]|uniref:Uncharacterized protein n=1 Tax=Phlyctema vagabunda TaxID=108571 RepID=A0ABR4PXL1_9HELO
MASNNPAITARRVLSALDANASIGKSTPNLSGKPGQVVEKTSLSKPSSTQQPPSKRLQSPASSGLVGEKRRRADSVGSEDDETSERAQKRRGSVEPTEVLDVQVGSSSQATQEVVPLQGRKGHAELEIYSEPSTQTDTQAPAPDVSLTKSPREDDAVVDADSQNTVSTSSTIPNELVDPSSTRREAQSAQEAIVPGSPRTLSKDKFRKHAAAIKLRLGLASYKIRTNQLDVPLQRLQYRTMSSRFPPLPRLPPVSDVPRRRIPESSSFTVARVPDIQVQRPTLQNSSINSTPAYSPEKAEQGASPTTILPRQREALLNPPQLQRPSRTQTPEVSPSRDSINNVVSEGAVDGLLSLMGARR